MFSNVGGEIKGWAKFTIVMSTILWAALGGMLGWMLSDEEVGGIVWGVLLLGFIGFFLSRLAAMMLYAFGQLVESVDTINELLHRRTSIIGAAPKADKQAPPPVQSGGNPWRCRTCGEENTGGALLCKKCNSPR